MPSKHFECKNRENDPAQNLNPKLYHLSPTPPYNPFPFFSYISFTNLIQMSKINLAEFEEVILMMVAIFQEGAYGNLIVKEIELQMDRKVNLSSVHVTLYRLEDKGLVKSEFGGATKERGGRRKRIFRITSAGLATLEAHHQQRIKLYELIPQFKFSM